MSTVDVRGKSRRDFSTLPAATTDTLREYFFGEFLPAAQRQFGGSVRSEETRVKSFLAFAGGGVRIREITEDTLKRFHYWCRLCGHSSLRASWYVATVRGVLRSASAGQAFPPRRGGRVRGKRSVPEPRDGLRRWFRLHCENDRRRSDKWTRVMDAALDGLERHVGHVPTTADLNETTVNGFLRALAADGVSGVLVNKIQRRLIALWRSLARRGKASPAPDGLIRLRERNESLRVVDPADGLRRLLHERYAPARRLSPATAHQIEVTLNRYRRFLGTAPTVEDLADQRIQAFMLSIISAGRSPRTANRSRDNLLALWRFLVVEGEIVARPRVKALADVRPQPLAWLPEECRKLWKSLGRQAGVIAGIPAADWWQSLHVVLWDTGVPISVALRSKWDQVDLAQGWFTVPASDRKFWKQDASFRLSPHTLDLLREIEHPKRDLVWPFDESRWAFYKRYNDILRQAGLPADRRSKTRRMRTSAASYYAAAGGDVTLLLGHRRRETTERHLDPRIVPYVTAAEGGAQ